MSVWDDPTPVQLARRAYLAPLFAYLREHGIASTWVARRVAARRGYRLYKSKLIAIRFGECVTPRHFVADCCRELERSPVEVMGVEWVVRHAADLVEVEVEVEVDADLGGAAAGRSPRAVAV